jgi:hypothetical protein
MNSSKIGMSSMAFPAYTGDIRYLIACRAAVVTWIGDVDSVLGSVAKAS